MIQLLIALMCACLLLLLVCLAGFIEGLRDRKATWIDVPVQLDKRTIHLYRCSKCGAVGPYAASKCPDCGVAMEVEENDTIIM